jgi:hypothetical protein
MMTIKIVTVDGTPQEYKESKISDYFKNNYQQNLIEDNNLDYYDEIIEIEFLII